MSFWNAFSCYNKIGYLFIFLSCLCFMDESLRLNLSALTELIKENQSLNPVVSFSCDWGIPLSFYFHFSLFIKELKRIFLLQHNSLKISSGSYLRNVPTSLRLQDQRKIYFFFFFLFYVLNYESMITQLQESWRVQNKVTYSSTMWWLVV